MAIDATIPLRSVLPAMKTRAERLAEQQQLDAQALQMQSVRQQVRQQASEFERTSRERTALQRLYAEQYGLAAGDEAVPAGKSEEVVPATGMAAPSAPVQVAPATSETVPLRAMAAPPAGLASPAPAAARPVLSVSPVRALSNPVPAPAPMAAPAASAAPPAPRVPAQGPAARAASQPFDPDAIARRYAAAGLGHMIPDALKQAYEQHKLATESRKAELENALRLSGVAGEIAGAAMALPQATRADVEQMIMGALEAGTLETEQARSMWNRMPPDGPGFRSWLRAQALQTEQGRETVKQALASMGDIEEVDDGASIRYLRTDPVTGEQTALGAPIPKRVSPDTVFSANRADARQDRSDRRADERFARAGTPTLSPAAQSMLAEQLLQGKPANAVFGGIRGKAAEANVAAVYDQVAVLAAERGIDASDIIAAGQNLTAATRYATQAAAVGGRIAGLKKTILGATQLVRNAMRNLPPSLTTQFTDFNALTQWAASHRSDPRYTAYATNVLTLVNEYAKLTNGGSSSVSAQDHAREVLNLSYGTEGMEGVLSQIEAELKMTEEAYQAAPREAIEQATEDRRRAAGVTPVVGEPGANGAGRTQQNPVVLPAAGAEAAWARIPSGSYVRTPDGKVVRKP